MAWRYGLIKRDDMFCLEEVYDGYGYTDSLSLSAESLEEFLEQLQMIESDVKKGYYEVVDGKLIFREWDLNKKEEIKNG